MNTQKIIIAAVAFGAAIVGVMTWAQDRPGGPAGRPAPEAGEVTGARADVDLPVARITEQERAEGFVPLIGEWEDGGFHKHGWNHYGPGTFTLDHETGVLTSHGGMGLLWYAARKFGDFVLRLEFRTSGPESNSGVFLRVPELVTSDEYIFHSFEIQICGAGSPCEAGVHATAAVYDAAAPTGHSERAPGEWNEMEISFMGDRIIVDLNDVRVNDWRAEPRGKVRDFAARGYIGLQNHDWDTSVYFRNMRVRALD